MTTIYRSHYASSAKPRRAELQCITYDAHDGAFIIVKNSAQKRSARNSAPERFLESARRCCSLFVRFSRGYLQAPFEMVFLTGQAAEGAVAPSFFFDPHSSLHWSAMASKYVMYFGPNRVRTKVRYCEGGGDGIPVR